MIGRLRGKVISKRDGQLMIDVGGVGYVVLCSDMTLRALPSVGEEAIVHTDLVVREDLMQLYGFASTIERDWYWLLTSVQGVGAKAALAILGTIGTNSLGRALISGDINTVRAAPGIGPKIAQRICNELKEKAAKLMSKVPDAQDTMATNSEIPAEKSAVDPAVVIESIRPSFESEAISALVNLGYDRVISAQTVARFSTEHQDLNALITAALRAMAPKG